MSLTARKVLLVALFACQVSAPCNAIQAPKGPAFGPITKVAVNFSVEYPALLGIWPRGSAHLAQQKIAEALASDLSSELTPWSFSIGKTDPRVDFVIRAVGSAEVRVYANLVRNGETQPIVDDILWGPAGMAADEYRDYGTSLERLHDDIARVFFRNSGKLRELRTAIEAQLPLGFGGQWIGQDNQELSAPLLLLSMPEKSPYIDLAWSRFRVECSSPAGPASVRAVGLGAWKPLGQGPLRNGLASLPESVGSVESFMRVNAGNAQTLWKLRPGEYFLEARVKVPGWMRH